MSNLREGESRVARMLPRVCSRSSGKAGKVVSDYQTWIGKRVSKISGKPFKCQAKVVTVAAIIKHPITGRDAFTFTDDLSFVECGKCQLENES